ncbi:DUF1653 domain-containing protein [Candidatus Woesearchaeota archaeon]|jgi:hypothetical protein|nr:DUF1653 domain-containing protein [Candidatus Woesearchaeota archaeon]MBT4151072.1 DUF1653 domain-containing protein [Candidatus Woesearchaeota archaeon]MBT4247024.1 DUF1653 domain-containing protein [Candidatus Woesearchaeota archaeon]MBT4433862.1 DUF1653 domain-containing protein [Candidatus Woesearchaeota archaeon]MBT7332139.1 DUF1653 domain-containing protein [Candidatus Woesearchaeota archaeon]
MSDLRLGVYRHYKGDLYHVFGESIHTETREVSVLYRKLNDPFDKREIFAHPKKLFLEQIVHEGRHVLRFEHNG